MELFSIGETTFAINPELASIIIPLLVGGGILFAIFFIIVLTLVVNTFRSASRAHDVPQLREPYLPKRVYRR